MQAGRRRHENCCLPQAASDAAPTAAGKEATPPSPKTPRAEGAAQPGGAAPNEAPPPAPRTPDTMQRNASAALACFGLGPKQAAAAADGGEEVEGGADAEPARPPGVIGLKNNGAATVIPPRN